MKKLLLLVLFTAPMFVFAQNIASSNQQKGPYGIAMVYFGYSKSQVELSIDDGSGKKTKDMMIKDEQGKNVKFKSEVSALNYLAQNGWSIVSSYEDVSGGGTPNVAFVIKRS
jgi:hypothetical protein